MGVMFYKVRKMGSIWLKDDQHLRIPLFIICILFFWSRDYFFFWFNIFLDLFQPVFFCFLLFLFELFLALLVFIIYGWQGSLLKYLFSDNF
jgi:hypothetical protein